MDRLLQQRLLGAAILLAVLVIVVPELLDGSGHRSRYPSHIEIPEEPEFRPLPEIEPLPIEQPDMAAQPVPETMNESAGQAIAKLPTAVMPVTEPVTAAVSNKSVAEKQAATPIKKSATAAKPAWALQIGSFGDKKNALKMRDQFRAKGFAAYVDDEKGVFRVRIGPELDRQRMEKMQERVFKQEKIKGMIVTHP